MTIRAGQKIALVGSSGSGKTTLLTLLRGLYDAQNVALSVDGDIFTTLAPLSGFTTLVPQDSEVFENTVRYNLTLGIRVPEVVVHQAVSTAAFDEVLPRCRMASIPISASAGSICGRPETTHGAGARAYRRRRIVAAFA